MRRSSESSVILPTGRAPCLWPTVGGAQTQTTRGASSFYSKSARRVVSEMGPLSGQFYAVLVVTSRQNRGHYKP